jgi:uncharacterized RDD family membrane protein YckC
MAERVAASRMPARLAATASDATPEDLSGVLGARVLAYVIDSVVVAAFAIAFSGLATLYLLLSTDGGFVDAKDNELWNFVYITLAAVPAWIAVNLLLLPRRGQTVGYYMTGLATVTSKGLLPSRPQVALRMIGLDPLAFHPVIGFLWLLAALISPSKDSSFTVFVIGIGMAILCLVSPVVAWLTCALDHGHRGLHDRIAGLTVVRLE